MASTGSTDSRRSMNVRASADLRSAHCRSSMKIATELAASRSPTTSSSRAPTANDETAEPVPSGGATSWEAPPAARSSWSASPKSRSASACPARAASTLRLTLPAPARQRRARAVFPTPGSPSMATSHGCPASTMAMTSVTWASSATRPTKTPCGDRRSCTRPPRSRPRRQPPGLLERNRRSHPAASRPARTSWPVTRPRRVTGRCHVGWPAATGIRPPTWRVQVHAAPARGRPVPGITPSRRS